MQYKGFIIRKTNYNQYEISIPDPLQQHLAEGWPFPSTIGVKDTQEAAKKFADEQIEEMEYMIKKYEKTKQLMKGIKQ